MDPIGFLFGDSSIVFSNHFKVPHLKQVIDFDTAAKPKMDPTPQCIPGLLD